MRAAMDHGETITFSTVIDEEAFRRVRRWNTRHPTALDVVQLLRWQHASTATALVFVVPGWIFLYYLGAQLGQRILPLDALNAGLIGIVVTSGVLVAWSQVIKRVALQVATIRFRAEVTPHQPQQVNLSALGVVRDTPLQHLETPWSSFRGVVRLSPDLLGLVQRDAHTLPLVLDTLSSEKQEQIWTMLTAHLPIFPA